MVAFEARESRDPGVEPSLRVEQLVSDLERPRSSSPMEEESPPPTPPPPPPPLRLLLLFGDSDRLAQE